MPAGRRLDAGTFRCTGISARSTLQTASIFDARLLFRQKHSRIFLAGLVTTLVGVGMLVSTNLAFSRTALLGDASGVTTTLTALMLLPIALATGEQMLPVRLAGWLKLVGIALISHACGQGHIAYALAHLLASFSSVSLLQPVMAVLAGIYLARRGS